MLSLSAALFLVVEWLYTRQIYIFAGDWGKGFGIFCEYFIYVLFVVGLAFTLLGNVLRIMRKERD
jgi:hypothetical protein